MRKQTKHTKLRHKEDGASTSVSSSVSVDYSTTTTTEVSDFNISPSTDTVSNRGSDAAHQQLEQIFWTKSTEDVEKTREEEFDDYLADLLL